MGPRWLPVRSETIPAELRELPAVLWRAQPVLPTETNFDPKPRKIPCRIAWPSRCASSTDPDSWGTFDDAIEAYVSLVDEPAHPTLGPIAGVGGVLTREAGITVLDLDSVIDPTTGALDVRAETIVERWHSWTEISPGGQGLHIWVLGAIPAPLIEPPIEVYSCDRYIAMTGWRWPNTPDHLRDRQAYLDELLAHRPQRPIYTGPSTPPPDDLAAALGELLATAHISHEGIRPWSDGYKAELRGCPWASEHTSGPGGAMIAIHRTGATDFKCLHAHCAARRWPEFRAWMEAAR